MWAIIIYFDEKNQSNFIFSFNCVIFYVSQIDQNNTPTNISS